MVRRAAVYISALALTIYLFFMYDDTVIPGILVLELLYPAAAFLYLQYISGKLLAGINYAPAMGEKNQPFEVGILAENSLRMTSIRLDICMSSRNNFAGRNSRKILSAMIDSGKKKTVKYVVQSQYCGNVEICMEYIKIYDLAGIFYKKINTGEKKQIGIMPRFTLLPLEVTRRTREFITDSDEHSIEKSGDDPSEIYQIREYRDGDSVHDIHWKLSAKEDRLMVKEHALPLGCAVLIWVDFSTRDRTGSICDKIIEQAASLSLSLIQEKCIHMAAWFEEKNQRIVKRKIDSEEEVYALVWRLLVLEPYEDRETTRIFYEDAFRGEQFSSTVTVSGDKPIMVNGQVQELLQV